tara:strand:- start:85 stop:351 length:267 start_codon:yes stop_codon:yes gene_type:complete
MRPFIDFIVVVGVIYGIGFLSMTNEFFNNLLSIIGIPIGLAFIAYIGYLAISFLGEVGSGGKEDSVGGKLVIGIVVIFLIWLGSNYIP